ncbi:hypothetical protein [Brucella intermedia]|uniref:hypothetical protein n=1 Tax=Brucella intermedia TaxID=94625 RepID=UPI00124EAAE7|nr:hypothetical protein [Brucella intermedia]KAB2715446.1 hypothetical protein F9K75_17465 [Brucella intermedia]
MAIEIIYASVPPIAALQCPRIIDVSSRLQINSEAAIAAGAPDAPDDGILLKNSAIAAVATIAPGDVGPIGQRDALLRHHAIATRPAAAAAASSGHIAEVLWIADVVPPVAAFTAIFTDQVVLIDEITRYGFSMVSTLASASASASDSKIRRRTPILPGSSTILNLVPAVCGTIASLSADSTTCSSSASSGSRDIDIVAVDS